jgi:hypothetical protein
VTGPTASSGAMPTTVSGWLLTRTLRPRIEGSPPKWRRHPRSVRTTTAPPDGPAQSASTSPRPPRIGPRCARQIVAGDEGAAEGFAAVGQRKGGPTRCRHGRHGVRRALHGFEILQRGQPPRSMELAMPEARELDVQLHERRGLARDRRAKQHPIEHGKDHRVHADADDEREHDSQRYWCRSADGTKTIAQVGCGARVSEASEPRERSARGEAARKRACRGAGGAKPPD